MKSVEISPGRPQARYSEHSTIGVDDVLIDHTGQVIEDVGWLWNHKEKEA